MEALVASSGDDGPRHVVHRSDGDSDVDAAAAAAVQSLSLHAPAAGAKQLEWYYIDADRNYVGPVDTAGLQQLLAHEYVNSNTYMWASHLSGWSRVSALLELTHPDAKAAPAAPAAPPHAAAPEAYAAPAAPAPVTAEAAASVPQQRAEPASPAVHATAHEARAGPAPPSLGLRKRQQSGESLSAAAPNLLQCLTAKPAAVAKSPPLDGSAAGKGGATAGHSEVGASSASPCQAAAVALRPATTPRPHGAAMPDLHVSAAPPRTEGAPEADDPWDDAAGMRILDSYRRVRSVISATGEVVDFAGSTMAYIEPNGEVGSHEMQFLGKVHLTSGQVVDRADVVVGEVDPGRGYVKNAQGSVVAEVSREGVVSGNSQRTAGYIQGFAFDRMYQLAAYVLLVDYSFAL